MVHSLTWTENRSFGPNQTGQKGKLNSRFTGAVSTPVDAIFDLQTPRGPNDTASFLHKAVKDESPLPRPEVSPVI